MNQNFERAFQLSGQVALITGGGSGLGYATAKCMAAAGAVVVIMGRREEVLQKACAELGDTVHYIVHDITDVSAAQTVIDRIVRDYGSIDIIVNNAGRHCKKPVEEICIQDFKACIPSGRQRKYTELQVQDPLKINAFHRFLKK